MTNKEIKLEEIKQIMDESLKILEQKIVENDKNIKKILTKIEQNNIDYNDIKIVSYLDN